MTRRRYLERAPITEALIDIRVKLPSENQNPTDIEAFYEAIKEQYPERKTLTHVRHEIKIRDPNKETTTSRQIGYRIVSGDGLHIIQAKIDGFTFSRLKPYAGWETLHAEAKRTWAIYRDILKPEVITRVAARYINQLDFPDSHIEFNEYLTAAPIVPSALPQVLAGFFSRVVVPDPERQLLAIITQAFQPVIEANRISVVLDIDVSQERLFENELPAWDTISKLRDFKNLIFFDCITEKTAELFE